MMKGLCNLCFRSNAATTLHGDTGQAMCTACIKRKSSEPKPVEHCNCKVCPVHNDVVIEPEPAGVPEG